MDRIIEWLVGIEQKSGDLYSAAAERFRDDDQFSGFLRSLAADEYWHHSVINSAADIVRNSETAFKTAVILDDATRLKIEEALSLCRGKISSGDVTIVDVIDCIVSVEFSEWNDLFLYVLDTIKGHDAEFRSAVLKLRAHKEKIRTFVQSLPKDGKYADVIKKLPHVWNRNILVVDDEPAIANFLSALLEEEGVVQIAKNGRIALDKANEQYFDVILSDVKMPLMNGLEFYEKAAATIPDIGKRFVFFSGSSNEQHISFFEENGLRFLLKPAPIKDILRNVHEILMDVQGEAARAAKGDAAASKDL